MHRLWEFACTTPEKPYGQTSRKRKAEDPTEWAGYVICMMLYLLYLVSMTCLLRYDEALRITWADVVFQVKDSTVKNCWLDVSPELFTGHPKPEDFRVKLNLPFRKTHQYGGEHSNGTFMQPLTLPGQQSPHFISMLDHISHGCVLCELLLCGGQSPGRRSINWMVSCFARGLAPTASVLTQLRAWYYGP